MCFGLDYAAYDYIKCCECILGLGFERVVYNLEG